MSSQDSSWAHSCAIVVAYATQIPPAQIRILIQMLAMAERHNERADEDAKAQC